MEICRGTFTRARPGDLRVIGTAAYGPSKVIGNRQVRPRGTPALGKSYASCSAARRSARWFQRGIRRGRLLSCARRYRDDSYPMMIAGLTAHGTAPECHCRHRGARHCHCPLPRVRWVAGRCRQWPAYLRRLTPAVSGNELTTCMPNPPRLPVAVADLASSGRGRGSNGVSGPIMPGLMAWRQSHRADSAVVTIGTAAPVGSDLSALVRSGIPFQHVCPDPAAPGNLDTLFPGPGAHGSPVHRK